MSEFLDRISKLSPQRLALLADELNERLQAVEKKRHVPLAIVGIGCRLPGEVRDPDGFWDLLRNGVDAISEVPSSRWGVDQFYDRNPDTPGKMSTRWGGFIEDPDLFDPKFFGIAPAEATSMDPQQRLLLETAWESLEHAGIAPSGLAGTQTGVFIGICNSDYSQVALNAPREMITPYFAPGLSHAVAAGRISYVLGLQGPNLAVDTSCSASLVAIHLACQSLRLGESDMALAGGVNLIFNQDITIALSQGKMMAPDGRCKAFSESANGFVRGEGCGIIVLKRLPDAIRDRNRILAVIRGSACNQDGRSSGLTAPNGPSQEAVIATALADAGLHPDEVDAIEAHGTGTALGDPIEAGALNTVFASRSVTSEPLFVGSVKTNLGHLEAAAGIAGLIKLVLSIRHGEIPPSLHLETPNSRIEWDRLPIKVPTTLQAWNRRGKKRIGGISSFGFSGTNAHVIVEEYLDSPESSPVGDRPLLLTLSARTESALKTIAARLHRHLTDHPSISLADVARTLNTGRSHFECRAGLTAASHSKLLELLSALQKNVDLAAIQTGRAVTHSPRVAFVFTGEQLHERNDGRTLYDTVPVFRESLLRCEEILRSVLEKPLTSMLYPQTGNGSVNQVSEGIGAVSITYRKAANFALQYALAETWRACGIEPAVALGFGVGEYVAACIAGVFSLQDGLLLAIADDGKNSAEFKELVQRVSYHPAQISFISNGNENDVAEPNFAEYWLRCSEREAPTSSALSVLAKENCVANLYLGDNFSLQKFIKNNGLPGRWLASFGKEQSDTPQFMNAAAALYVLGCELNMDRFYDDVANTVSLPTYPFERERYWLDTEKREGSGHREAGRESGLSRGVPSGQMTAQPTQGDEWIYDVVWEPKALPEKLRQHITGFNKSLIEKMTIRGADDELLHFAGLNARLDPACSAYILIALQKMGASSLPHRAFTLQELGQELKVAISRQRLFERLIAILIEDDLVKRTADGLLLADFVALFKNSSTPEAELHKVEAAYPQCQTEINVLRRCGENLAGVLLGHTDPVHLLFSVNSMEEMEHIYRNSPMARFYNETISSLVRTAVDQAAGRVVRILEIGAGTGATSSSVLPGLAESNIEYFFTDVSPAFVSRARGKFSNFSSVNYQILDIEKDPMEQGFEHEGYDIVIAANVLHATADLRRTIFHAQKLLAPGGLVLLLEGVQTYRCADLTFGLTDGWWRFVDSDIRKDCPLVSGDTWTRLLREAGMASTRALSYLKDGDPSSQQMLIVAQASGDSATSKALPQSLQQGTRNWIIFADESGVGVALQNLLVNSGEQCHVFHRPHTADEIDVVLNKLQGQADRGPIEIVYLWGVDASGSDPSIAGSMDGLSHGVELCAKIPAHLIQATLKSKDNPVRIWMVTSGAVAAGSFSPNIDGAIQSLMWGIGRTLGLEISERYGALIDLDPTQPPESAAANLLNELLANDVEDQIAFRKDKRLVARLKSSYLETSPAITLKAKGLRRDSSYLITGGLGGVGLRLASWAALQGAGHLVLLSRTGTGLSAGAFAEERLLAIEQIQKLGATVTVVEGDVASAAEMNILFRRFGGELPLLRGIFHAATDWNAAGLVNLTDKQIDIMLRPKVLGTWILHEMTKSWDIDFFLAFSSAAAVFGSKGMAHYAAANQFMDSFAHSCRMSGYPMLSVNWGTWDVMRMISQEEQARFAEAGILTMPSDKVLNLFGDLIASKRAQVMIASIDWNVLHLSLGGHKNHPLLENFGVRQKHTSASAAHSSPSLPSLHGTIGMTQEARKRSIEAFIVEQAARVLGFRGGDLPPIDVPLMDIGLDSLMAVDLKNRLQTGLGLELSPMIVFDYPTISEMVGMLETMLWATYGDAEDDLASSQKDEIRI